MVTTHVGLPAAGRARWARRPGRQFSLTYWSHVDSAFPPGSWPAGYRSAATPARAGGTGGPGGPGGTGGTRRTGGSGPAGSDPAPARRGWLARALDLIATGLRFGAPWAWTVHLVPPTTTPGAPDSRVPNGAESSNEGWN